MYSVHSFTALSESLKH